MDWLIPLTVRTSAPLSLDIPAAGARPVGQKKKAFRVQLWLPCLCSQTVFPFIPLSAYSVYFGALLHHRGPTEPEKENISADFQFNDTNRLKLLPALFWDSAKDKKG